MRPRRKGWRGPPWGRGKVAAWVAVVVVLAAVAVACVGAVSPDGEALLAFKAGLSDPAGALSSWRASDRYPCLWEGVTCNAGLRVQRLLLQGTQLSGAVSGGALRNLSELRTLVLARNNFSGALPPELGQIGTLWKLNVSENGFTGALPAALGGLARLRMLDVSRNAFTGTIPAELFQACQTLRYVSLAQNQLAGAVPATLWQCATLEGVDLAANALQGALPATRADLPLLEFLDLGGNPISGVIPPALGALARLQSLSLASMRLEGSIPATFANLTSLQRLNLSANNLTGEIVPELGALRELRVLLLQMNSLDGPIPASLGDLANLTAFNVSYNKLSGRIPASVARFGEAAYVGNAGLCGPPLTAACAARAAPRRLLSVSALIAIAAAGTIALGVVLVAVLSLWAMRRRGDAPRTEILVYESTPPSPEEAAATPIVGKLVLFNKTLPTRFEDWETGTKALLNKECLVGRGSLGTVYRATFDDGVSIAIKRLETLGRIRNAEEFEAEMDSLGDARHAHLVVLQGYYWSASMQLALWDWVANGTLAAHLHAPGAAPLVWSRRFRIALGMARGLAYLHHDLRPPVLHLNLSSANVLLDAAFEPKLSDFGMAKLLDAYAAKRPRGYVAPELAVDSPPRVTPACDVFSFGMVLLELVTGRHPSEPALPEFVIRSLERGRGPDCFDPKLTLFPEGEVVQVLKLALVCTAQVASNRPTMGEAVQVLESVKPSGSWTSRSPSP